MIKFLIVFFIVLVFLALYRLLIGPTITDRLVAADTIGILIAITVLLIGLYLDIELLVDVVLAYAVLFFIDVLIFSKYFEHRELWK